MRAKRRAIGAHLQGTMVERVSFAAIQLGDAESKLNRLAGLIAKPNAHFDRPVSGHEQRYGLCAILPIAQFRHDWLAWRTMTVVRHLCVER
jgi:hypothetical protein